MNEARNVPLGREDQNRPWNRPQLWRDRQSSGLASRVGTGLAILQLCQFAAYDFCFQRQPLPLFQERSRLLFEHTVLLS